MRKKIKYLIFIVFFLTNCALQQQLGMVEGEKVSRKTEEGLHTVMFETPNGKISVNLPDDTAREDVISGTVIAEPAGKTEKERAKNRDVLNGYVVEIDNQRTPTINKLGKWLIPAVSLLPIILWDPDGKEVGEIEIPVLDEPPEPVDFQIPTIGQAGHPIVIPGTFDGDYANTGVQVGDEDVSFLAESPRQAIFESPQDITGSTVIRLTEGDFEADSEFRNIDVNLAAPKLTLTKGEMTELTVTVGGLEGFDGEIPLQITNVTPGVVDIERGGTIIIKPDDIEAGVYTHTCPLTGISPGAFVVSANVLTPYAFLELISPADGEEIDISNPTFQWTPVDIPDVTYTLTAWQLPEQLGERVAEGYRLTEGDLAYIEPYFVDDGIIGTSLISPRDLEPGFTYGGQVESFLGNNLISSSMLLGFSLEVKEGEHITEAPYNTSYIPVGNRHISREGPYKTWYIPRGTIHIRKGANESMYYPRSWIHISRGEYASKYRPNRRYYHVPSGKYATRDVPYGHLLDGPYTQYIPGGGRHISSGQYDTKYIPRGGRHISQDTRYAPEGSVHIRSGEDRTKTRPSGSTHVRKGEDRSKYQPRDKNREPEEPKEPEKPKEPESPKDPEKPEEPEKPKEEKK